MEEINIKGKKKKESNIGEFKQIYQYKDGIYLPDTSQPNPEADYEITSNEYTPHKSTRYYNVMIGDNGKAQYKNQFGDMIDCDKDLPYLYDDRENCCGCTACYAICPVHSIIMRPDEEGFLYPVVNAEECIRCYKCTQVCPIINNTI